MYHYIIYHIIKILCNQHIRHAERCNGDVQRLFLDATLEVSLVYRVSHVRGRVEWDYLCMYASCISILARQHDIYYYYYFPVLDEET